MRNNRIVGIILAAGVLLCVAFIAYVNVTILQYRDQIISSIEDVPERRVALVFGGGMFEDGTQSDTQLDRVMRAIELYQSGKVEELLMTGDDGSNRFNEVDAMHDFAVAAGMPDDDVHIDPHGYNTYKSCYRAKHVYQLEEVIAISQAFHLSRIQFFCESMGIDTVALSADLHEYGLVGKIWHMNIREAIARTKGWTEVVVTQPIPEKVGEPVVLE